MRPSVLYSFLCPGIVLDCFAGRLAGPVRKMRPKAAQPQNKSCG